jgi:hypothetical protein
MAVLSYRLTSLTSRNYKKHPGTGILLLCLLLTLGSCSTDSFNLKHIAKSDT